MSKTYTLNEYYSIAESTSTRAEVYPDNTAAAALLAYHKQNGAVEVSVWECISQDTVYLPMPNAVISSLNQKIRTAENRVIITGIDAYLSLLSEHNVNIFNIAIHNNIDEDNLNCVYLISKKRFDETKYAPKYIDSLSVVYLSGDEQSFDEPIIMVIPDKWITAGDNPTDWKNLLKIMGQFDTSERYTFVLKNYNTRQAGLSSSVMQLLNITETAERYYNISAGLPENILETLITESIIQEITPLEYLKQRFDETNLNTKYAVIRLLELNYEELWTAYIWLIKTTVNSETYLYHVLSDNIDKNNFLSRYISGTAINLLHDKNNKKYAVERASAIRELSVHAESFITEFITNIEEESNEIAACWLNCGTEAEYIEIIRRVSVSGLSYESQRFWHGLYPLLDYYLSDKYDYGDNLLNRYFHDYRKFKIADCVDESFVKRAFDAKLPSAVSSRDVLLQKLSGKENTGLLIADGMGAEYYPLILAMAEYRGINIESSAIASVKLPSSTKFNKIEWDPEKTLTPGIYQIDNISHDGAVKHENCSSFKNIAASLNVFEIIMNRISEGLTMFDRVVLTSDHGSSRLAVIANEKGLITTLPWDGEPDDWRYSAAPVNNKLPPEFESYYDIENNKTYWIVRGYNRLPKKGGKLSVHGGAALEERLVPVIVFTNSKTNDTDLKSDDKPAEQLIEKSDFII